MIRDLRDMNAITSDGVENALATVPRHLFAPDFPLSQAYAPNESLPAKYDANGDVASCTSAAHIQAVQLEQADIRPGMRVLEIGSGGYNAALIAELVGSDGAVTTIDIDADVTRLARERLDAAGYGRVRVVTGDAEHGVTEGAPYDRIVITVRSGDVPPAWIHQLAEDGVIVMPLHVAATTRTVAFVRTGDTLASRSYRLAHFVPMQGIGARPDHLTRIAQGVGLRSAQPLEGLDTAGIEAALRGAKETTWSGAAFDMPDELDLYLLTNASGISVMHASQEAVDAELVGRGARFGIPAIARGASIAWYVQRGSDAPELGGYESGVAACGPDAAALAADYLALLRRWARQYRHRDAARICFVPHGSATSIPEGWHGRTRHGTLAVSWP